MLTRKRQVPSKIESVEGVAETLAIADAKSLAYNPKVNFDPGLFKRNPARASLSNIGDLVGKRPGSLTFGLEIRGSGVAATQPDWAKHLRSCGAKINALRAITIGAISGGPFVHGETVTGGTSTATGRVIIRTLNGTTTLYLVVLTGTFQSGEVLTGGTSGATATSSSLATVVGNVFEPDSVAPPSQTMQGLEDGISKLLSGCRGKCKLALKSGEPGMFDFEFSGVEAGVADQALYSAPAYETTKPPVFLGASFTIDGAALKITGFEIDFGQELSPVDDVSSDRGISHFNISERRTVGSFPAQMVLVAVHAFHSKWFAGTEMEMNCAWGSVAGNKFRFYAPRVQYTKIEDEDIGGTVYAKAMFNLNGTLSPGDDEFALLCL